MSELPRPTENVIAILDSMLARPRKAFYGLELANDADIGTATIYAALARLERANLVAGMWEDIDPAKAGRPRRRLYRLTAEGARVGDEMVKNHRARREARRRPSRDRLNHPRPAAT